MNAQIANLGSVIGPDSPGERLAFIGLDSQLNESRCTYRELDELANGIARALLARGFVQGERIALLTFNSVACIAAVLGIMRAGLVAVPVNHRFPRALVDYVIADSGARLLFCDAPHRDAAPDMPRVSLEADELAAFARPGPLQAFQPLGDEPAMMLYTSGSTGKPKGVVLSHRAHLWIVRTRLQATPLADERALIAAPLYHMNALALALLVLASGATAILLPQFSAVTYIEAIQRYRCTWLTAVPPMIAMMLREQALLERADLSSVRVVRMGSAPVSASLLEQIHRLLPNARIINAYGTTEGGPVVFGAHPQGLASPVLSVGHAHPDVQLRLRDEAGLLADEGVLELESPGLMSGYHNRPDLAAPFTADGFYVTGDVFRRDAEGFHTFVGRRDDMFVSGGENIYPGEVEKLLERHPGVQQACVVPVEDEIKGFKPMAFVVRRQGSQASEAEIKAFSLEHAPAYQHPRRVWFVDTLPLASTHKIDRKALLDKARQNLQDSGRTTGALERQPI
ncbi:Acyl-CoA synthetase (AMP-forming)/AMP-acid ligase II [Pseudomonas flavescens]|uniref:Acyl-CoA synthetase (AMP-forming)/AMP-acid ligase II n=1 Tax=Phytopseudomonas flavescens TaxID=29435 RepID=A0A1G7YZM5_9GAMM|nr:class I adenylate-forming enzyme family protein [Pseudomonas flavescens]SDH01785.1 Acyl-CoA synthetase (AMP-forming)/AMP-acid ligase II [Pseudomonas flavescens]